MTLPEETTSNRNRTMFLSYLVQSARLEALAKTNTEQYNILITTFEWYLYIIKVYEFSEDVIIIAKFYTEGQYNIWL